MDAGAALAVAGFVAGVPTEHVAVAGAAVEIHIDEVVVEARDERFIEPSGGGDLVPHRAIALAEARREALEEAAVHFGDLCWPHTLIKHEAWPRLINEEVARVLRSLKPAIRTPDQGVK